MASDRKESIRPSMTRIIFWLFCATLFAVTTSHAAIRQTKGEFEDKFRQLDEVLPTANTYRTAGGEPGHKYGDFTSMVPKMTVN